MPRPHVILIAIPLFCFALFATVPALSMVIHVPDDAATIQALPSLVGTHIFDLRVQDTSPPPSSDPPWPAAGQVVQGACTIVISVP